MEKESGFLFWIEIILLLISLGFATAFLVETYRFEDFATSILPSIISAVAMLFCIYFLTLKVVRLTKLISSKDAPHEITDPGAQASQSAGLIGWWQAYLAMVGFFLLIYLVGILWATLVYCLAIPFLMGYRNWKFVLPVAAGMTLTVYLFFSVLLKITLPKGILFG